jgi:hypothetical protein
VGKPNPQNLKPFKKGQSGNPKGGAAKRSIEKIFRDFLFDIAKSKDGQERERLEVLMARLFADGAQGNTKSTEIMLAYGFGKPLQKNENTNENINVSVNEDRMSVAMDILERLGKNATEKK